jgi:glyoxylase-like metal-dependent hydrolase (beta-lactamase superfamily II)
MAFHVTALKYMHIDIPVPGCAMFFQQKVDSYVEVVGYFFLVRGEGHNILVDTGMGLPPEDDGAKRQVFGHFCVEPTEDTTSLLAREGLHPDDIDVLILTHLHTDHCWNTSLFRKARIYMSKVGWKTIQSPRHAALIPEAIYPRTVYSHLKDEAWKRVVLIEHEHEILPGVSSFWVGGHSACSHVIAIETHKEPVILAGDIAFYYANLEENIPVAYNINLAECYEAMDRIRGMSGIVVPSHDPEILKRHPGGVIA